MGGRIKWNLHILGIVAILGAFFSSLVPYLKTFEYYLIMAISLLISMYFVRALYEGKRCGVCQLGNTAAMAVKKSIHLAGLYLLNYWFVF